MLWLSQYQCPHTVPLWREDATSEAALRRQSTERSLQAYHELMFSFQTSILPCGLLESRAWP